MTKKPKLVAISGKANSGKNTVADMIGYWYDGLREIQTEYEVFAFADPIKNMILEMYPDTDHKILRGPSELRMTKIPNSDKTYRNLLIDLGALGRSYDQDVWAKATIAKAKKYTQGADPYRLAIISDVRAINELFAVKEDFYLIRVIRPNNAYENRPEAKDISETSLDHIPFSMFNEILVNDGDINALEKKIKELVLRLDAFWN